MLSRCEKVLYFLFCLFRITGDGFTITDRCLRAFVLTCTAARGTTQPLNQPEKYRSPPVARTALNRTTITVPSVSLPLTEPSWKDALFLFILTLLMDGGPGRNQKAAIFLGSLFGFETLLSCFQITQIFLTNCARWNVWL